MNDKASFTVHGSQNHQASYSKPSGASYAEGGAAWREADCSHRSNAELKTRGAVQPPLYMPSWHAEGQLYLYVNFKEKLLIKVTSKRERSSDTENDACKPKSRACGCLDISKWYKMNIAKKQVPMTLLKRPDPLKVFFFWGGGLRNS